VLGFRSSHLEFIINEGQINNGKETILYIKKDIKNILAVTLALKIVI
jgi:hypothetical protein